jgi:hypothetical protein
MFDGSGTPEQSAWIDRRKADPSTTPKLEKNVWCPVRSG